MLIDQKIYVADVSLACDLVEKHPDEDGGIDGKHQAPGVFPHTQIHSAPETTANQVQTITRRTRGAQRAIIPDVVVPDVVPAKPTGRRKAPPDDRLRASRTHNHRWQRCEGL